MNSKSYILNILLIFAFFFNSCYNSEQVNNNSVSENRIFNFKDFTHLNKLNTKLGEPEWGEWLDYKDEPGQPFEEYINSNPVVPTKKRNKIYILPIGNFNDIERYVLDETAEFMHLFFHLEVVIQKTIPSSAIPKSAQRNNFDRLQFHTKHILYKILMKNMPDDAIVYTAITSNDLYPADDWNFVFGQANIKKRVGVSSIYRLKYDELDTSNYHLFLKRIAKTATHETCHMFSMLHCKDYKCMMNGSMHLEEADSKPMHLCPNCLAKLIWCTNQDVIKIYDNLKSFFDKHKFTEESKFCIKSKKSLLKLPKE